MDDLTFEQRLLLDLLTYEERLLLAAELDEAMGVDDDAEVPF